MIQPPISESEAAITHVRHFTRVFRANILASLLPDALNQLLGQLSESSCDYLLEPLDPANWVETRTLAEIREAYRRLFHIDAARVRGAIMIEQMLASGRMNLGPGPLTPQGLLQAIVEIFPDTHKGGRAEMSDMGDREAEMHIWASFPYPQYLDVVVPEILHNGLLHLGLQEVRVDHEGPDRSGHPYLHRYRISW